MCNEQCAILPAIAHCSLLIGHLIRFMEKRHLRVADVSWSHEPGCAERCGAYPSFGTAFPLTLALSLREREYPAPRWEESRRFGFATSGERFSLSPGERAGVRAGVASSKIEDCSRCMVHGQGEGPCVFHKSSIINYQSSIINDPSTPINDAQRSSIED